jgi:CRISPR-associated protein Cas2
MTASQMHRLRWELTELLTAEDDVLLIPLCGRCVDGMECVHSAVKSPDWPEEPPGHRIV